MNSRKPDLSDYSRVPSNHREPRLPKPPHTGARFPKPPQPSPRLASTPHATAPELFCLASTAPLEASSESNQNQTGYVPNQTQPLPTQPEPGLFPAFAPHRHPAPARIQPKVYQQFRISIYRKAEVAEEKKRQLIPTKASDLDMENHSWGQILPEVMVTVPVPLGTKARDVYYEMKSNSLKIRFKGQDPIVEGELFAAVKMEQGEEKTCLQAMTWQSMCH